MTLMTSAEDNSPLSWASYFRASNSGTGEMGNATVSTAAWAMVGSSRAKRPTASTTIGAISRLNTTRPAPRRVRRRLFVWAEVTPTNSSATPEDAPPSKVSDSSRIFATGTAASTMANARIGAHTMGCANVDVSSTPIPGPLLRSRVSVLDAAPGPSGDLTRCGDVLLAGCWSRTTASGTITTLTTTPEM